MVRGENSTVCIVQYQLPEGTKRRITLFVRPSYTVRNLYNDVERQLDIKSNFVLILKQSTAEQITLSKQGNKTLESELDFNEKGRNMLYVELDTTTPQHNELVKDEDEGLDLSRNLLSARDSCEDDLALGASASPDEYFEVSHTRNTRCNKFGINDLKQEGSVYLSGSRTNYGYVGLVNQAMTCYLNSLLQALFMTPEFRNALYEWEFDGEGEAKSIPYQLQKLFLNLQKSSKIAVETTDLTQSFGWDSTEAWQQHDIQELCRILFDALEQKFKDTRHNDLIKRLYEGKMMDYVKCLECSTEKSREDAFLDIPLPVRPFGNTTAYGSVEEALRAFVQPETLDGTNQYFCEKCNKKCDAHKGLKFTKFPYILTLHLKRFDFDYNTFHRIKLNDKVTFPQILNLNSFVSESDSIGFMQPTNTNVAGSTTSEHGSIESAIKFDDCSTTDSGSALEEDTSNGILYGSTIGCNNIDHDLQEDDEGIDMASSTIDNKCNTLNETGPYLYDLFAIMIHSGSTSGGHYYAYIRDFENEEWFCFNDQSVTTVSQEDIEKSFGGSSTKTFYSSAYSTSTNAYMLMYRQNHPLRNVSAMKANEFPIHIVNLLNRLKEKEENDRKNKAQEEQQIKLKVFFCNQKTQRITDVRIYIALDATLNDILEEAHTRLKVNNHAPIEQCRLVAYNNSQSKILQSFEGHENEKLERVLMRLEPMEMLLEIRDEMETFEPIPLGSELIQVYTVDLGTGDIDAPIMIRVLIQKSVRDLYEMLSTKLNISLENLNVALLKCNGVATLFSSDTNTLEIEDVKNKSKIFVTNCPADYFMEKQFVKIVERFEHIITLHFVLPNADKETLEKMGIPSYEKPKEELSSCVTPTPQTTPTQSTVSSINLNVADSADCVDAVLLCKTTGNQWKRHPIDDYSQEQQPSPIRPFSNTANTTKITTEMESNSEDSSLSEGDKTLIESPPDLNYISSTNNSPSCSDTHLSSPDDYTVPSNFDYSDHIVAKSISTRNYYFKAVYYEQPNTDNPNKTQSMLKVLVDTSMIVGNLKSALQPYVKVPKEYFKIFRVEQSHYGEKECTRLTESLRSFKDTERLIIELGRALRSNEHKCKIYYFKLSEISNDLEKMPFLCDWILCKGAIVSQVKREIIAHLQTLDPVKYNINFDQCRLRMKKDKQATVVWDDDDKFGDNIRMSENFEIVFQFIEDPLLAHITYKDSLIFIRQWHPAKLELSKFKEVIVSEGNDLKTVISKISGIAEDQVEYAKMKLQYLCNDISILNIHTELNWSSSSTCDNLQPNHGEVFYYKDKNEQLKQLTPAERNELSSKNHLIYKSSYPVYHSPRRERSLKIYLDSPKKRDD